MNACSTAHLQANSFNQICKLAFKVIHSSTVILPAWKELMKELKMTMSFLPRNVATRWNLTLDLLDYALRHRKVVDGVTQKRDLGLRKYEVLDAEWVIMEQLRSVLEVSCSLRLLHAC